MLATQVHPTWRYDILVFLAYAKNGPATPELKPASSDFVQSVVKERSPGHQ